MFALRPITTLLCFFFIFFSQNKMSLRTPPPPSPTTTTTTTTTGYPNPDVRSPNNGDADDDPATLFEDFESACSTPYVSAPSSPGRSPSCSGAGGGFFYSAPASPMHFVLTSKSASSSSSTSDTASSVPLGFEFEFSARFGQAGSGPTRTMSSADELFLNGKIRPMKLSTHLEKPQSLTPLLDLEEIENADEEEEEEKLSFEAVRGRDLRLRDKSLRRRTRSMSPLRCSSPHFEPRESADTVSEPKQNKNGDEQEEEEEEEEHSVSASSSRSSSAGRNSKRWLFLKEFLRSKSEGRSNNKFFWSTKKLVNSSSSSSSNNPSTSTSSTSVNEVSSDAPKPKRATAKKAPVNGVVGKKKTYEMHYTANRAHAEEMRKKTYLPYRQGLLGCLGFSSKGYGAVNGFARALNPVSSR